MNSAKYEFVRIVSKEAQATLWLDHPPVNVLNIQTMEEIIAALREISKDEGLRLLIVRGSGKCFSAGMDISEHLPDKAEQMIHKMHSMMTTFASLEIPTMSVIHGSAFGGGLEFAAIADLCYATADSKIGVPEIKLGVFPPLAIAHFPELIGIRNAYDLILTGRTIDAAEGLQIGLLNGVFRSQHIEMEIQEIADRFLAHSKASMRFTKRALQRCTSNTMEKLQLAEDVYLDELMRTEDALEGLKAFLEKRKPNWRHC